MFLLNHVKAFECNDSARIFKAATDVYLDPADVELIFSSDDEHVTVSLKSGAAIIAADDGTQCAQLLHEVRKSRNMLGRSEGTIDLSKFLTQ